MGSEKPQFTLRFTKQTLRVLRDMSLLYSQQRSTFARNIRVMRALYYVLCLYYIIRNALLVLI